MKLQTSLFDIQNDIDCFARHCERSEAIAMTGATLAKTPNENDLCFLYTSSMKGNTANKDNIRFLMRREDAENFCSDDRTRGSLYGHKWAYFFTSVENFKKNITNKLDIRKLIDNGKYDSIMQDLRIVKIPIGDFKKHLEPLGFYVRV